MKENGKRSPEDISPEDINEMSEREIMERILGMRRDTLTSTKELIQKLKQIGKPSIRLERSISEQKALEIEIAKIEKEMGEMKRQENQERQD